MELSERLINKLEDEGFSSVFEWQDAPGTTRPLKQHQDNVAICVADGSMTIDCNGVKTELRAGQRFNIPPAAPYSISAGDAGAIYIVGEMEEEYL